MKAPFGEAFILFPLFFLLCHICEQIFFLIFFLQ